MIDIKYDNILPFTHDLYICWIMNTIMVINIKKLLWTINSFCILSTPMFMSFFNWVINHLLRCVYRWVIYPKLAYKRSKQIKIINNTFAKCAFILKQLLPWETYVIVIIFLNFWYTRMQKDYLEFARNTIKIFLFLIFLN